MDESAAATMQNTQMLREIRDEIRTSRNVSLGAAGMAVSGNTGLVAKAQAASDRVLAADWASLGWSSAYSSQIKNNLFDDVGAVTGLSRSPSSLTQSEYYGMARENLLTLRPHNLITGILAPGYSARVNSLADTIFANSPRFARFGSSDSPLGIGLTRTGAYGLAKAVQGEAFTNMRLSGADLSQIAATGLQSGQFDATSASDFMSKLKELAAATADVTRSMRMTVSEASQAMGGLRNIGVTGVGEQRNVLMGVGAAAGVAGLTTGEMLAGGFNAASTGVGMGLGGGQSMLGFARNAAQMRALTQSGAVSEYTMARGGGATGVASTIFNAEAQFATSDAGYFSYIGRQRGKTGNFYDELSGGVSEVAGGGFFGGLRSQRRRADVTSRMSDEDRRAGLKGYISQQIEMFGVRDQFSEEAQDLAFNLAKNMGMDEASAQIYTTANFSKQGVMASDRSKLLMARSRKVQERKLADDELFTYNTIPGRFARAKGLIGKAWAGAAEWTASKFTAGQTGFAGLGGTSGNLYQQRQDVLNGTVSHNADITALVKSGSASGIVDAVNLYDENLSGGWGAVGGAAGMGLGLAGGTALGMKIGAGAGVWAGPIGLGVGIVSGAILGAGLGLAGEYIGSNAFGSPETTSLKGAEARQYLETARAMRGNNSIQAGKDILKTGKLSQSAKFRAMSSGQMNRGVMGVRDSAQFSKDVEEVVRDTGASVTEVVSGLKAAGVEGNLAAAFSSSTAEGPGKQVERDIRRFVGEASTVNFMLSENASALQEFVSASPGRGVDDAAINSRYVNAVAGLKGIGVTSEGIEKIYTNIKKIGSTGADAFAERLSGVASYGASRQIREIASGVMGYAEDLVGGTRGEESKALKEELKTVQGQIDSGASTVKILDALMSKSTKLGGFLSSKSTLIGSISDLNEQNIASRTPEDLAAQFGMSASVFTQVQKQIKDGTYTHEQGVADIRVRALTAVSNESNGEGQSSETKAIIATFKAATAAFTEAADKMARI